MLKVFHPGEPIVREGTFSGSLFVIKSGKVKIETRGESYTLSEGDFFGEECSLFQRPAPYSAVAAGETQLETMDRAEAADYIAKEPEAAFRMFVRYSARLYDGIEPLTQYSRQHVELLSLACRFALQDEETILEDNEETFVAELTGAIGIDKDKLLDLLKIFGNFGYIGLDDDGKIRITAQKKISGFLKECAQKRLAEGVDLATGFGCSKFLRNITTM
ncbi:cyclic nucleotide-binding domain-containing protein [bacterium]|nr:cyclic nucleotide-binding domain-containing protein [bacterium]